MDAQAQLLLQPLASAGPRLGGSPVPRHWPCLCHFPCCCQWDGAHSYPETGSGAWVCLLTGGRSGSAAGCTSRGHHYRHHHEQQLSSVPPATSGPASEAGPPPLAGVGKAAPTPYEQLQLSTLPVSAEEPEPRNNRVAVSLWYDRSIFTHTRARSVPLHTTQSL